MIGPLASNISVKEGGKDAHSTTVAPGLNTYDQFIITDGAFREFGTTTPVLGTHVGIIPFNRNPPFSSMTHSQVRAAVSDHRPLWIRFRADLADDN